VELWEQLGFVYYKCQCILNCVFSFILILCYILFDWTYDNWILPFMNFNGDIYIYISCDS